MMLAQLAYYGISWTLENEFDSDTLTLGMRIKTLWAGRYHFQENINVVE